MRLVTIGRGGDVALADSESQPGIINTVREEQDMVTARASHQRLALTGNALLLAVDAPIRSSPAIRWSA